MKLLILFVYTCVLSVISQTPTPHTPDQSDYHQQSEWLDVCKSLYELEQCSDKVREYVLSIEKEIEQSNIVPVCINQVPAGPSGSGTSDMERYHNWNELCKMMRELLWREEELIRLVRDSRIQSVFLYRHLMDGTTCEAGPSIAQGEMSYYNTATDILNDISSFKQKCRELFLAVLGTTTASGLVLPACKNDIMKKLDSCPENLTSRVARFKIAIKLYINRIQQVTQVLNRIIHSKGQLMA